MLSQSNIDIALLAPVPEVHLKDGGKICDELGYATFGSDAVETFAEFRAAVGADGAAEVLFYASHSKTSFYPSATYRAIFVRWDGALSNGYAKPNDALYRPPSTLSDSAWKSFYVVRNLQRLEQPIRLTELFSASPQKGKFRSTFIPQGPIRIARHFQ